MSFEHLNGGDQRSGCFCPVLAAIAALCIGFGVAGAQEDGKAASFLKADGRDRCYKGVSDGGHLARHRHTARK
ncbi:MAG: hypothetical protein FWD68_15400 [Alphaproteobacteria bacterium]|nr:hypothetical protein [Alphaproteobacteria bacterium]